jgi:hypothetical protein
MAAVVEVIADDADWIGTVLCRNAGALTRSAPCRSAADFRAARYLEEP